MSTTRPTRLIVAVFAALAMAVFVNARTVFAQDAAESGTSVDANWERTTPEEAAPALDETTETPEKVLEIPQAPCNKDGAAVPCDDTSANADEDGNQTINAPQPGAPPQTFDENTASNAPDDDWGTVNDYQSQQVYAVPYAAYGAYPYSVANAGTRGVPSQVPASAYAPMSSPVTQAARPPLNQGPWMTPSSISQFSRPAGSPMMGMTMARPAWGFHH
ncbi:MAG TPA: hypothetical protein VE243_06625 [Candidatus Acidoferrum sp.]|nr:hypothetical protein [Candidatus Acidoferrum sp.]